MPTQSAKWEAHEKAEREGGACEECGDTFPVPSPVNCPEYTGEPYYAAASRESDDTAPLTFTLTITLGNAGMQTYQDVHDALRKVADFVSVEPGDKGPIRDVNGNTVGSWAVA